MSLVWETCDHEWEVVDSDSYYTNDEFTDVR